MNFSVLSTHRLSLTVNDMTIQRPDISRLSDAQVRSLLAVGEDGASTKARKTLTELKRTLRNAEDDQLSLLMQDLRSPLLSEIAGPLSFQRLATISAEQEHRLGRQTILDIVTSQKTPHEVLNQLVRYGEMLQAEVFPATTRLTGNVLTGLAKMAIVSRGDRDSIAELVRQTTEGLRTLKRRK